MKIACISDLHGEFPELESGDLLLIAGDHTSNDSIIAWKSFYDWLQRQDYKKKVMIAGNHDQFLAYCVPYGTFSDSELEEMYSEVSHNTVYLKDNGIEYEGLKIWGSPWSVYFDYVNPHCAAFMLHESQLQVKFNLIPGDTDILVTHSPPYSILDRGGEYNHQLGSVALYNEYRLKRISPKIHVFGHIHEAQGIVKDHELSPNTVFVNASHMDRYYQPTNKPTYLEI